MPESSRRTCPAGHSLETSWDVCPHCEPGVDDLASTRVQGVGATQMIRAPGAPALVGWLVVLSGAQRGTVFPLREEKTQIGGDPACQVRLTDEGISDAHARLLSETAAGFSRHILVDLDSTNGTYLNERERRVEREEIVDGDLLRLGETELIFKALPTAAVDRLRDRPGPSPVR